MEGPQDEYRGTPLWPLGVLLAVFAVADLMIVPTMFNDGPRSDGLVLIGVLMGLMASQAGLVTLWAVFGAHPWALRWLTTLAAAELLLVAFLVGIILGGDPPRSLEEFAGGPLCLPLAFLILQAPLWLFRAITGWQIVPRDREETSRGARQFGIVDLLAATTFTALALGLTQVAFSLGNDGRAETPGALLGLVFGFAIAAAVNALLSLPCLWAVFAARKKPRAVGVLVVYYALLGIALLALLAVMTDGSLPPTEAVGFTVVFEVVVVAVLVGGLCLIRAGPYGLLRPRRKRAAADGGTSPFAPVEREERSPGESLKAES